ncbi:MAG: glycosyltransferase [Lachnospiraceae bacterium]|nr:glycosyltransferase [Lachnospiraceae bacterium]
MVERIEAGTMNEVVKISIIVPIYRIKESYLKKCVNSLQKQTLNDIEILLIDDGSPDQCGILCDEYARVDRRIRVFHQQNKGVAIARNIGMLNAIGKYLMFVDPDDWMELDCCERLFMEIENRDVEVVLFQRCGENEYTGMTEYFEKINSCYLDKRDLRAIQLSILRHNPNKYNLIAGAPWGKLIKREYILNHEIKFPEKVRKEQDDIFSLYLFEHLYSAYFLDYIGYHYRINSESINHRYNPDMPEIRKEVVKEAEKFIHQYHINEAEYESALGVHCVKMLYTVELTYFFHKESLLKRDEIINICMAYLEDELVKKYRRMCNWNDFETFNWKLRYLIERPNRICLMIYYYLLKLYRKVESI